MGYKEIYRLWVENPYFDDETREELARIEGNEREIEDRFYKDLEFGTAGLRGIVEAGTNRMNKYTVRRATYGLAKYILNNTEDGKERGVVIAHDNRNMSVEFCRETAETLAASGIKSYIFNSLRTTPELSFATRELNCIAGVVITASHNPREYNGYKVYGEDGAQFMPEIASLITDEVNAITDYSSIPVITDEKRNLINVLGEEQDKKFIDAVKKQIIRQDVIDRVGKDFKIVYTPLCGTGNVPVRRALKEVGFENIEVVPEEENPDVNFAGIEYPNPEDGKALVRAVNLAREKGSDLVIATDPDCDRVGTAVRTTTGEYELLTGNQIGGLLADYIISSRKELNTLTENPVMIKSIVTSEFGADIAKSNGVDVINVLTGFKFIGEKIRRFEKENTHNYVFGYEESYGYLVGTHARDKDAVVSTLLIAEMAAYYRTKGKSLYEALQDLYKKYGYYREKTISMTFKGKEGSEKIKKIMESFRNGSFDEIAENKVSEVMDFSKGVEGFPKSDVLKYIFDGGNWLAIRPSGTEPKLKFYIAVSADTEEKAGEGIEKLECFINEYVEAIK